MSQTHFPCPFCGRKMGVGPDLLGRKVRCPHCKQVIVAPAAGAAASPAAVPPPPPPTAPPVAVAPPPPQHSDLPVFNLPSPEAQDSIFGEAVEDSDEVFGSDPARPRVPEMPPPVAPPPAAYAAPPAAVPAPPAANPAPADANPFAGFAAAPAYPAPVPAAPPVASANQWEGFAPTAAPPQAVYATPAPAEPAPAPATPEAPTDRRRDRRPDRDERRERPERRRPTGEGTGGGAAGLIKIGFFLLIPYALLMTVLAVYGLFIREGGKLPEGHPLSLIPDTRGEFPPADRKKSGKVGVPLDGPLPPELRAGLGKAVTVGAVEVEPVSVAVRKLNIVTEREDGKTANPRSAGKGAVLMLKVKNTSPDLTFHPLDPAFNRTEGANDSPPTALVIGKSTYAGGPVSWPFQKGVKRAYEAAQADDDKPLGPGESRTYAVTSGTRGDVVRAVQNAKDTILWRVQIRRGLVEFRGREVPVTTLIGVEFNAADVTTED